MPRANGSRRIPALLAGILFSYAPGGAAAPPALWESLFGERAWAECRREALRAAPADPRAAVIADACLLRMPAQDVSGALGRLQSAAQDDRHPAAPTAALEIGRHELQHRRIADAWPWFARALVTTKDPDEFVEAGSALAWIGMRRRDLLRANPSLADQLASGRSLWTPDRVRAAAPGSNAGGPLGRLARLPAHTVVHMYRSAIRPAIGRRCNLEPSCSAYFLEASRRHGLAGIPMLADRLVREPGVNSRGEFPVLQPSGDIRYADPIENHDFWFHGKDQP